MDRNYETNWRLGLTEQRRDINTRFVQHLLQKLDVDVPLEEIRRHAVQVERRAFDSSADLQQYELLLCLQCEAHGTPAYCATEGAARGHDGIIAVRPAPASTPSSPQQIIRSPIRSQLMMQEEQLIQAQARQRLEREQHQVHPQIKSARSPECSPVNRDHQLHQQGQHSPQPGENDRGAPGPRTRKHFSMRDFLPILRLRVPAKEFQKLPVLYKRYKRKEISKAYMARCVRVIVGESVLEQAFRDMLWADSLIVDPAEPS